MRTHLTILLTTLALFCGNISLAQEVNSETKDGTTNDGGETVTAGQAEFEALSKQLTNSVFEGQFTIDGQDSPPKKEQYFLKKVKKLPAGDYWLIQTRIKYGDHDVTVPLSLPIKWSGKTPVITVDNVTIPGLGTFNARVLIADGKYAGTWQHGKVGGHLFGSIKSEKQDTPPPSKEKDDSESAAE